MMTYACRTAQDGYAAGKAFLVGTSGKEPYRPGDAATEVKRLDEAVSELERKMLAQKEQAAAEETALLDAQILILKEDDFLGAIRSMIPEKQTGAPDAIRHIVEKLCEQLQNSDSEYIRERCDDLRGLGNGLITLIEGTRYDPPAGGVILVGTELSPSDITLIGKEHILGILTEKGSATSHVSVLAGSLDVPYLYGLEKITDKVRKKDALILDGTKGEVIVNPTEEMLKEAGIRQEELRRAKAEAEDAGAAGTTKTVICANIASAEEADGPALKAADGIGLFRSEFLYLNRKEAPSEEEQFAAYRHVVEAMNGRETVIRTMDIGSDKQADWMELPGEPNPAMGLRGIRVSLKYREHFRTQLRALLRAAVYGKLRILIPMVASVWEVEETRKEIREAAEELKLRNEKYEIPELGVMIETPAAVMIASELAERADFFSIGTNDLTQYALAVDRESNGPDAHFDPEHEAVLRMIAQTTQAAHEKNIPVAICGEMAGNTHVLERLLRIGVDELSVSPAKLGSLRLAVAETEAKTEKEKSGIH